MTPIKMLLDRLKSAGFAAKETRRGGWEARCPAHDGDRHNLSIDIGDDGRVLMHCHAHGCKPEDILAVLGMEMKDLFPSRNGTPARPKPRPGPGGTRKAGPFATPEEAIAFLSADLGKPTGSWQYPDAAGAVVAWVVRFDPPGKKKEYRPISLDPATGRCHIGDPPGLWPLYRSPELLCARRVYVVEGEKCADLIRDLGLCATTTAHGARSPHKTDLSPLAGKEVVILPDVGEAGEVYARNLVALLAKLDPRPTVKIVRLPGLTGDGDDIEQWLEAQHDSWGPDECRLELERLADKAAEVDWSKSKPTELAPARQITPRDTSDDDATPIPFRPWPDPPDEVAYHGLAGEIVRAIEPESEADPAALLVQLLVAFGNAVGRLPHYLVESTRHYANEYAVLVGETATGRKGTAKDRILDVLDAADPVWVNTRIMGGLSSGEGLISAVRDSVTAKQPIKEKGRVVDYQDVMVDEGVADKRLLILETEFGGVLRALQRDGNKLSALLRQGWDHGTLATLTKSPFRATGAHISIIGHITAAELLALLSEIDAANGLANRFLWLCVRRSRMLPHGGRDVNLTMLTRRLTEVITFSRHVGRMAMTGDARALSESQYERLTTPPAGALGPVISRAAPHTLRLAMEYALLDGTEQISPAHLEAGLALWDASFRSAQYVFGDSTGNDDADRILKALREAPSGMTRSEIRRRVFGDNLPAERVQAALSLLLRNGLIKQETDTATGGPPAMRYSAVRERERREKRGNSPQGERRDGTCHVNHVNHVHVGADRDEPEPPDGDREVVGL
jgi:hypothetical protein